MCARRYDTATLYSETMLLGIRYEEKKKKGTDHLYYEPRVCLRLNRQVYMKRPPNSVAWG